MRPDIRLEIARLNITDPTEIAAKEAELEADWYAPHKLNRRDAYPSLTEQLDMQYHDKINGTTTWADAIQAVKDKYPKPE